METTAAPTAIEIEVEIKRTERYACGCTSTRIHTHLLEPKWRLTCPAHQHGLTRVETVMEYRPALPEEAE